MRKLKGATRPNVYIKYEVYNQNIFVLLLLGILHSYNYFNNLGWTPLSKHEPLDCFRLVQPCCFVDLQCGSSGIFSSARNEKLLREPQKPGTENLCFSRRIFSSPKQPITPTGSREFSNHLPQRISAPPLVPPPAIISSCKTCFLSAKTFLLTQSVTHSFPFRNSNNKPPKSASSILESPVGCRGL